MADLPPNRVKVFSSTSGTGSSIALGARISDLFASMVEAGGIDGRTYDYIIEQGGDWEHNSGIYSAGAGTIARGTPLQSRIGGTYGTTKITLNGTQVVYFPYFKETIATLVALSGARTRKRYYTVDGTVWSKPTDAAFIGVAVYCYGPGGGGGGSSSSSNTQGAGGGGGGFSFKQIAAASLAATVTLAIGTGGAAGATTGNGGAGSKATAFGAHCSAGAGSGGKVGGENVNGSIGGTASGGDINLKGGDTKESSSAGGKVDIDNRNGFGGGCGYAIDDSKWYFASVGNTGVCNGQMASFLGGAGGAPPKYGGGSRAGQPGAFPGGGGSGGYRTSTSQAGAVGGDGWIILEEQYG